MEERKSYTPFNSDLADFFLCTRTQIKSESPENIEPEPTNYIPQKRKNTRQPKDPSGKFYKTLPGFLVNLLESQGPTPETDLIEILAHQLPTLRNTCGSLYKNTPLRCLNGVCNMPMFVVTNHIWNLDPEEVGKYRDKFMAKVRKAPKAVFTEKKGVRKSERVVTLLKGYSLQLGKDPRTEVLVKDPLKELTGDEDLTQAAKKLGYERLIGVLQAYAVVSKYYMQKLKKEDTLVHFNNIERDIDGIHSKLARIEGHLMRYSVTESRSESVKTGKL